MTKITLVESHSYDYEKNGEQIVGTSYSGFRDDGTPITFTSKNPDYQVFEGETKYNPAKCSDFNLRTKFWDGKVKFQDAS